MIKSVYYMIKVTLAILVCRISFGIRRSPEYKEYKKANKMRKS